MRSASKRPEKRTAGPKQKHAPYTESPGPFRLLLRHLLNQSCKAEPPTSTAFRKNPSERAHTHTHTDPRMLLLHCDHGLRDGDLVLKSLARAHVGCVWSPPDVVAETHHLRVTSEPRENTERQMRVPSLLDVSSLKRA